MARRAVLATVVALGIASACSTPSPAPSAPTPSASVATSSAVTGGPTAATSASEPRTAPDGRPFVVTEVLAASSGLGEPWAMAFLPDSRLLVTDRSGRLLLLDASTRALSEVTGVPQVRAQGQGGLGDIVLGPTFAQDATVYLTWVEGGSGGTSGAVLGRARLDTSGAPALRDLTVIWRQEPTVTGSGHFSHRVAFSPDGRFLFLSSGDRQKLDPAQDLSSTLGKILRLTPDGQPAPGNPFADRGGVSAQIWSLGHRNPLGLAFDDEGRLWSSEMGPQGGDEVNLIEPGLNYGWPKASNGSHYGGADIPDHRDGDGFRGPVASWNPSISPGGLSIYRGRAFPQFTGDAFVPALSGQAIIRVDLQGGTGRIADTWPMDTRIRAVHGGPDGALWVLTDGPGGRLLRLAPAT